MGVPQVVPISKDLCMVPELLVSAVPIEAYNVPHAVISISNELFPFAAEVPVPKTFTKLLPPLTERNKPELVQANSVSPEPIESNLLQ
jgi:hypothetical protein